MTEIPMYYKMTSGGAEYLCSNNVAGTNIGCLKDSTYIVRIDGNIETNGSEMIIKNI